VYETVVQVCTRLASGVSNMSVPKLSWVERSIACDSKPPCFLTTPRVTMNILSAAAPAEDDNSVTEMQQQSKN
jgi:hypothetical protein